MKKSVRSLALLSTAALALGMGISGGASAAPAQVGEPQILAKDLAGPLSTAVAEDGTAYVTANFGGSLCKVAPGGDPELVFQSRRRAPRSVASPSTATASSSPTTASSW